VLAADGPVVAYVLDKLRNNLFCIGDQVYLICTSVYSNQTNSNLFL
jgi:hypothetical protein